MTIGELTDLISNWPDETEILLINNKRYFEIVDNEFEAESYDPGKLTLYIEVLK